MPDANVSKWPPSSRELGRRPRPDDYVPGRVAGEEREAGAHEGEGDLFPGVNLRTLQDHLSRTPLDEIATIVRGLTYGDMIDLANAIWRIQPEGLSITQDNLPALLHRWSKSHRSADTIAAENNHSAPGDCPGRC
jgi:hypothetical protein